MLCPRHLPKSIAQNFTARGGGGEEYEESHKDGKKKKKKNKRRIEICGSLMPDSALSYASWVLSCLPSCPSHGKLLPASAFCLMCIVALEPMVIDVHFVCLLTMLLA